MALYILMCRCDDMDRMSPPQIRIPLGFVTANTDTDAQHKADLVLGELKRLESDTEDLVRDRRQPTPEVRYRNPYFYCVPAQEVADAADLILNNKAFFTETFAFARYVETLQPA